MTRLCMRLFTANGTFVVPPGVTTLFVEGCGGGGGGGGGCSCSSGNAPNHTPVGGGGGGAAEFRAVALEVTPNASIAITTGVGGAGGRGGYQGGLMPFDAGSGGDGTNSTFGAFFFRGAQGGSGANLSGPPAIPTFILVPGGAASADAGICRH